MTLRERDSMVLAVLEEAYPRWLGPTRIGLALGYPYPAASSRVMGSLRRLVAARMVERHAERGRVPVRTAAGIGRRAMTWHQLRRIETMRMARRAP